MVRLRWSLPLLSCLALVASVSLTAAFTYGATRFRAPADVGLVVLASVGVALLLDERAGRRGQEVTVASLGEPAVPAPETVAAAGPAVASRA